VAALRLVITAFGGALCTCRVLLAAYAVVTRLVKPVASALRVARASFIAFANLSLGVC